MENFGHNLYLKRGVPFEEQRDEGEREIQVVARFFVRCGYLFFSHFRFDEFIRDRQDGNDDDA